jgi:tight adherence protein B
VRYRQGRQLDQITRQLPDVLTAVSKTLRAGGGVMQGLGAAATDAPAPLGPILQRALRDVQLGADLEDVFAALARRVGSPDLDIALTAIAIQRRTGGSLAEMLGNVTETLRERRQLEGDIRVLTTQQRMSAYVAAALPVFVAAAFLFLQPEVATLLFTTTIGLTALGIGIAFEIAGIWLIRELGRIEV